jgi:opacity protein-like surface antigen
LQKEFYYFRFLTLFNNGVLMNKIVVLSVLFLTIVNVEAGILPVGGYFGLRGGASINAIKTEKNNYELESKKSAFMGANAGIRLFSFRAELEGLYRPNSINIKKPSSQSEKGSSGTAFANLYYNVIDLPFIRGYLGGGVGYTKFTQDYLTDNKNSFAYNFGLGVTATFIDILSVDVGYRYVHQGDVEINTTKLSVNSNDLYAGLRFGF